MNFDFAVIDIGFVSFSSLIISSNKYSMIQTKNIFAVLYLIH